MYNRRIKVLVVDDHDVVRYGIIKSIANDFPEAEFGEAGNAAETFHQINEAKWDLVTLDICLPGRNGLEVLKELKSNHPEIPVIIFSMYPEEQFAVRAIKAGASAYLTKNISATILCEAIKKIINGGIYLTASIMELITSELRSDHDMPVYNLLSNREIQVFHHIASGLNVSAISIELNLSIKTISVYRTNILKKMNLKNNFEIIHYALKNNLMDPAENF